jgi:ATP-dependent helicase Lhr and Lhr-like helicase
LFSYVGAFMYEGDSPLAERRAQALALDSSLLAELLGQADLRELLDPAVVSQVEAELQRLAADRACRSLEAVADLLRMIGPLSAAEVAQRCAEPDMAKEWLAELDASRRAIEVRIGGEARWAAIEDAGRLRDALGVPLPPGVPVAFAEPVPDPLGDLVARYARCHGPFTAQAAAKRYGLGMAVIGGTLRRLAAEHRVVEGEFVPGGRGTEWCDAEVLRMLRRRCLAKLRKEVEPAPPEALAAFLPAWQNAGQPAGNPRRGPGGRTARGWRPASADAVFDAVDQLAGAALPASALETLVLPGRVPGYQPAVLDELTAAGEVVWSGAGGLPGGDGWVVLAPAQAVPLLLPPPAEITMTPVHDAILTVLEGGGGLFFRMIADRVAAMLKDHDWRGLSDTAVAAAIWDLVWAGRLTNDTLAPLRTVLGTGRPVFDGVPPGRQAVPAPGDPATGAGLPVNGHGRGPGLASAGPAGAAALHGSMRVAGRAGRIGARRRGYGRPVVPTRTGPPTVTGRWSLLPDGDPDPTRRLHAVAQALLDRHGIVTRGSVVAERIPGGFGAVYPVLRAMEEAGQCRRGYFVEGLGAAQFALPGAVDRMRAIAAAQEAAEGLPSGSGYGGGADSGSSQNEGGTGSDGAEPRAGGGAAGGHRQLWPGEPPPPAGTPGDTWSGRDPGAGGSTWSGGGLGAGGGAGGSGGPGSAGSAEAAGNAGPPITVLAAADPANAFGSALPWPARPGEVPGAHRPGRKAGALVVLSGGKLVLYVERGGKTLLSWTSDPEVLVPAAAGLAEAVRGGALGRLTVERADGTGVYDTPLAQALADAGFRPTPRGLRLRG